MHSRRKGSSSRKGSWNLCAQKEVAARLLFLYTIVYRFVCNSLLAFYPFRIFAPSLTTTITTWTTKTIRRRNTRRRVIRPPLTPPTQEGKRNTGNRGRRCMRRSGTSSSSSADGYTCGITWSRGGQDYILAMSVSVQVKGTAEEIQGAQSAMAIEAQKVDSGQYGQ